MSDDVHAKAVLLIDARLAVNDDRIIATRQTLQLLMQQQGMLRAIRRAIVDHPEAATFAAEQLLQHFREGGFHE